MDQVVVVAEGKRATEMTKTRVGQFAGFLLLIAVSISVAFAQSSGSWKKYAKCAVLVENVVEVPALESGVLVSIGVEKNQIVSADQSVAELDKDLADMELQIAKLQLDAAKRLAADSSEIEYQNWALEMATKNLKDHEAVAARVSGKELRDLQLIVEQTKVAVVRAQQAQLRAKVDSQLKTASVAFANLKLQRRTTRAPIGGIVSDVKKHPGQWVEAGEPILEIKDLEHIVVSRLIPLSDLDLANLQGSEVRIEVAESGGKRAALAGYVKSFDPEVSSQGLIRIHASVRNVRRDGVWLVLPGMEVTMYVSDNRTQQNTKMISTSNPKLP